ncbi:MAG TPA: NUDIX hydrolase [Chloroflexia bacterium]|nr:NUDIX hydrolase [Chloroflexia bacterium]
MTPTPDPPPAPAHPLEVLGRTRVYDGKLFQVDVEDVRLPSGRPSTREIVRHPGAVALVVVDPQEQLLLVRQYRRPADRILLEIPAGTREPGEDAEACARREVQEETGYAAGRVVHLGGFYSAPGFCTEYLECYLCTELRESRLPGDEDEDLELTRLSLGAAWAAAGRGDIVDAKTLAGLLLYSAHRGAGPTP